MILLAEPLANEDTSIALRKGNEALLAALNGIIAELKSDGTLADMRKRWLKPDLSPYEELVISLPTEGQPLKIGVSATREPLTFVDKNGRVTGHDGELARVIGAKLHRPVEFLNMKFMALIPALQSGKIDMIITGMTATDERKKFVDFTQPYFANFQVMLVKKIAAEPVSSSVAQAGSEQDREVTKRADLDGREIAVLGGSAGDLAARKHFPNAGFQVFTASADAALAVRTHKADAFVYDKSVLLNLAEKNPELVILDEPVDKLEVAAAIRKDNTALQTDINKALSALRQEGILQQLRAKWVDAKYTVTPRIVPIDDALSQGVLRMGTCATIEPFSFQTNGTLTGLDIELGRLIGQRLGKKIEIIDMNFEALIPALQAGKIDFALSNFNVTEERKKLILYSLPYIENDISALVRRPPAPGSELKQEQIAGQGGGKLASVADLKDKRIGVLLGSVHDAYAMQHYPNATLLQYKSLPDLVLAVKSGKADAAMYTRETLLEILRGDSELGLLGDSLQSYPIDMGFNKDNDGLREQFNVFLKRIKANGDFDDLARRWLKDGGTAMPAIANKGENGVLVVGIVSDKGLPFAVMRDGQLIGFDIELAERFGAYLGKKVQYADMEFGNLIAAVASGKIDMIDSTLIITDERKARIDFSDPYYELGVNVFALKKNLAAYDTGKEYRKRNASGAVYDDPRVAVGPGVLSESER